MFDITLAKLLEILVRVAVVYLACMILLRVSGRREMSELGPMDLLTMLLLSETVSPALTGDDDSLTAALAAASTLMALMVATSWLVRRSRRAGHLIEGEAVILIEDGRVNPAALREFRITNDDLHAALHAEGMMSVNEVARGFVEANGKLTFVKRKDHEEALARTHRVQPRKDAAPS
jgi:uncharacterized membrane protein YcaP (DUF421 family)